MANYYAQVTLAALSGETADANVNTFAVADTGTLTSLDAVAWKAALDDFYDALIPLGCLRGRAQTGHTVKIYPADTAVPNYPIFEYAMGLVSAPGALDMPAEVALCVSYANDTATSVPRARRRGRIYLSAWTEGANTNARPLAVSYEGLAQAYSVYVNDVNAITALTAGVWSRTNATVYAIDRVWCDNEWDTMRSRGGKSTLRYTQLI